MRVVTVCPYSLSRPGGVQGQATGLARSLRRLGHDVAVLAPADDRPLMRGDADFDGVHAVGRSVRLRSNGSVAPVSLSPAAAMRVERFVRRHRPDVVHLHEPMAPVVGYGCLAAHLVPLVATYHRSGDSRWYRVLRPLARWADGHVDARVAVSEAARDTAVRAVGGSYEVLFNGVEVTRFAAADPTPSDRPTVLFLGRHEARKGLAVLLRAFAAVPDPAVLWVAGNGPETAGLRRRFPPSDRVRWLGSLSDDEVAARLAGADVLCAPSLGGESFGMVVLEGMAARCAVVASDLPGYRAAAGGFATLVTPGDPGALGRALTDVLESSSGDGAPTASVQAAEDHARQWSMDHLAERYVAIYRDASQAPSGFRGRIA